MNYSKTTTDGTYIESCFCDDKPCGIVLIVKEDGSYFEGSIGKKIREFKGIFRNPGLKRTSLLAKDPQRSERMCYGRDQVGYVYRNDNTRYKGILSDSKSILTF